MRLHHIFHSTLSLLLSLLLLSWLATIAQTQEIITAAQGDANANSAAKNGESIPVLEKGKPIERELKGGESHSYQVNLIAGQYLHVVIEQKGIDVVVMLFGPDGKQLTEVDSPNGTQGQEPVSWIAETLGSYRLEVRSLEKNASVGRYQAKIEELRQATEQDKNRIAAQKAFAEGGQLLEQRTAESFIKAIKKLEQALSLYKESGDRRGEAYTLNDIGRAYNSLGDGQKAIDYYKQALLIWKTLNEPAGEAYALDNIGSVYISIGEYKEAIDYFKRALLIWETVDERAGKAKTLNNIGSVYNSLGEKQKALDYFKQALMLLEEVGDRRGKAATLNNIGSVYSSLGEKQKALDYFKQALMLLEEVGDRRGKAATLNNIGLVYDFLGDKQEALNCFEQSLTLREEVGDRRGKAVTLNNIGLVYKSLGQKHEALDYLKQSLTLREAVNDRQGKASALHNIGVVYDSLGMNEEALEYLDLALSLQQVVGDINGEALTLSRIAGIKRDGGELDEALTQIEKSLDLIESLRTKVEDQELRISYFASVQSHYEFYIDLLMRLHNRNPSAGYEIKALKASERARARSLIELLTEARADIRQGIDPKLLERERSLQQQIIGKAEYQQRLFNGKHTEEQKSAVQKDIDRLNEELRKAVAEIRRESPNYAALKYPEALTLAEIQQLLDDDSLLLEYALGEENSYLWAVTTTSITSCKLPKQADIEDAARQVYKLLTDSKSTDASAESAYWKAAATLSRMLLEPIKGLLGKKPRLIIVCEGALQYIPFSALSIPSTTEGGVDSTIPLIYKREIINLPSASTLALLRREGLKRQFPSKTLAIIGDSIYDENDVRVASRKAGSQINSRQTRKSRRRFPSQSAPTTRSPEMERLIEDIDLIRKRNYLPRLSFARLEAKTIVRLLPKGEYKLALGFAASKRTAIDSALSSYRIIHLISHGFLDSIRPELSAIVLSLVDKNGQEQDGFLRLQDIYNLNLPADLVVLSACQTALGKEIKGEGLIGLTRGFMYAGAARVAASLWNVDDKATSQLMGHFYYGMLKEKLSPASALRNAQIKLWKTKRWRHPYYWAAFQLQGEWR